MKRFTIRTLMAFIVITAVGLAGLRNASTLWAGTLLLATLGLLLTSVLRAIYSAASSRAGWLGFSLFGFAYLALVLSPIVPERLTRVLPTSQMLNYVYLQVSPPPIGVGGGGMMIIGTGMANAMSGYGSTAVTTPPSPSPPSVFWKSLFPGAVNQASFSDIGHCLFALLAGLLGAVLARRLEKSTEA